MLRLPSVRRPVRARPDWVGAAGPCSTSEREDRPDTAGRRNGSDGRTSHELGRQRHVRRAPDAPPRLGGRAAPAGRRQRPRSAPWAPATPSTGSPTPPATWSRSPACRRRSRSTRTGRTRHASPAGVRYGELAGHLHARRPRAAQPRLAAAHLGRRRLRDRHPRLGRRQRRLATAVRGLELVTADGDLVTLSRDADGDELRRRRRRRSAALGVVTALTLDVVPAFDVAAVRLRRPAARAAGPSTSTRSSPRRTASACSPTGGARRIDQVWLKRLDRRTPAARRSRAGWARGRPTARGTRCPACPPRAAPQQLGVPGPWHERLPHFRLEFTPSAGEELQSEYLVPRGDAVAALAALDRIARAGGAGAAGLRGAHRRRRRPVAEPELRARQRRRCTSPGSQRRRRPCAGAGRGRGARSRRSTPGRTGASCSASTRTRSPARYERLPDFRRLMRRYDPPGRSATS